MSTGPADATGGRTYRDGCGEARAIEEVAQSPELLHPDPGEVHGYVGQARCFGVHEPFAAVSELFFEKGLRICGEQCSSERYRKRHTR